MAKIPRKAVRLIYGAVALLAFVAFVRFLGVRLWPNARVAFMVISLVGIVVLLVIPLAFSGLGFYRSDSLTKVNQAMAREESESDRSR
jgi:amino acid transporter